MKRILLLSLLVLLPFTKGEAQWVVTDPVNLAGNIANTIDQIATTSQTVKNTLDNFKQVEKLYKQGKNYYDALKTIKNIIGDAYKVKECLLMVGDISKAYVEGYKRMLRDPNFSPEELAAIATGYSRLLKLSTESAKHLKDVVRSSKFSMNDKERIDIIDRVYQEMTSYKSLVSYYTRKNISVSYIRARERQNLDQIKSLYGGTSERYW